jgi:hypothetical protein
MGLLIFWFGMVAGVLVGMILSALFLVADD